jgi:hypothetical protein
MNVIDHFDSILSLSEDKIPICTGCCQRVDGHKLKSCAACKKTKYCSKECQVGHWKVHKKVCISSKIKLRFGIGDRVRCSIGGGDGWASWKHGTIIALYRIVRLPDDPKEYPYYIQCDDGSLIKAPEDSDLYIQKIDETGEACGEVRDSLRDVALFAEAPTEDDCPICGLRFPMRNGTSTSELWFVC